MKLVSIITAVTHECPIGMVIKIWMGRETLLESFEMGLCYSLKVNVCSHAWMGTSQFYVSLIGDKYTSHWMLFSCILLHIYWIIWIWTCVWELCLLCVDCPNGFETWGKIHSSIYVTSRSWILQNLSVFTVVIVHYMVTLL